MQAVLGLDEAGRGCVIGPLVVAGVLVGEERLEELVRLGVRDSKKLSRAKRERLAAEIERLAHRTIALEIGPSELAENLTDVELRAMAQIIRESNAERIYLDLPVGPLARDRFQASLQALLELHLRRPVAGEGIQSRRSLGRSLVAENGADARYPIVGAASIIAKVYRDRAIERLRQEYGDFGWGYPSEPKTRAFLQEFFERTGRFPPCARAKWRTVKEIAALKLGV